MCEEQSEDELPSNCIDLVDASHTAIVVRENQGGRTAKERSVLSHLYTLLCSDAQVPDDLERAEIAYASALELVTHAWHEGEFNSAARRELAGDIRSFVSSYIPSSWRSSSRSA